MGIENIAYQEGIGVCSCDYSSEDLLKLLRIRYGDYIKLELGPGRDERKRAWATIGLSDSADPFSDIYHDLEWGIPLPDECIDEIYSNQLLEHIGNIIRLMNDCWRVLVPGGFMLAIVPHWKSPWAWGDPTHKRVFTEASFEYYCLTPAGKPFVEEFSDYGIKCAFVKEEFVVRPRADIKVKLRKPGR